MALNEIDQLIFNNRLGEQMDTAVTNFINYKSRLQQIFDGIQGYIDNPDTPTEFIDDLEEKKTQGKALLQAMLNGIS